MTPDEIAGLITLAVLGLILLPMLVGLPFLYAKVRREERRAERLEAIRETGLRHPERN